MVIMLAFYNNHMNFYPNYASMLSRWIHVCWTKFIWTWPPRPSIIFSMPLLVKTAHVGYLAFREENQQPDDNHPPEQSPKLSTDSE